MANPLWNWGFFLIAAVLAILLFFKGKKIRKPTYYIKSHNLVRDFTSKLDKLQMFYGGTNVKNLTASKVAFWNDGGETINKSDIADTDPLRIEAVGTCEILDASVIKETDKVNQSSIEKVDNKLVRILFSFLDKGQGGAIQVIHTGKDSSDIKVEGFVKGAGEPLSSFSRGRLLVILERILSPPRQTQPKSSPAKVRRAVAIVLFIGAFFMLGAVFAERDSVYEMILGLLLVLIYVYVGYTLLKRRVPKSLEIVEEED